ncbi:CFAH factor, partial [Tachuris rubrigastra]|nr:CFAH factor [Tachuris rubrigastra]
ACEEPPPRRVKEVPTKIWDTPPYPHGTQVTYGCRPGYIKAGRIMFQCVNGAWQQQPPMIECKNKPCGHPGDTQFGSFELTNGHEFVFGARVEYRCNDGYQMLSQRNYRECQADGWSNDIPHCEVVKCLPVEAPENGRIIMPGAFELDQEYSFGQVVNFECNEKHKLVGAKEIICSSNGRWSNDVPQCQDIICDVPEIPNGYVRSPKQSYKELEVLQFSCNDGYRYGERADAICTESGWNPPPYCTKITCSPPAIHHGDFLPKKYIYKEGDTITVQCAYGYHFKALTDKATAECTGNGWVPVPACVSKPCDYPVIENGGLSRIYAFPGTFYFPMGVGQSVEYRCIEGYSTLSGAIWQVIMCSERGWLPEPKCLKKCEVTQIQNGYFSKYGRSFYKEGETTKYVCYDSYQTEHEEITCTGNGWSPYPRCIREKTCPKTRVENGNFLSSKPTFHLKEVVPYSCHPGFLTVEGKDKGETQCQENDWIPPPKCISEYLNISELSTVVTDILIYHTNKTVFMPEDTIEYSCLEGYKTANYRPTDTITCGINGEWSPAPKCLVVECAVLNLANRYLSPKKNKYSNGDVVEFTCAKNFVRVGSASIQCYSFGWFPSPPTCKEKARGCGPPPEITNGSIAGGSEQQYQHGDRKEYECNNEFKLIGSKEIECVDGQWSSPPSCIEDKMPCGSPSSIPNVVVHPADQTQFSHGDEVICGCKPGSGNSEKMKIKCLNGEWKPLPLCADPSPQCELPVDVYFESSEQHTTSRSRTEFHGVIHYRCTSEDKNTKQATCVSGKWTPEIECPAEKGMCPPPPLVSDVQQTTVGRHYRPGSKIAYSCPNGFQLIGANEITCTDGKWQSPPHCVERPCLPPPSLECADPPRLENPNLKTEREGKSVYLAGAKFKYVSRSGYTLNGSSEITCSMGEWTAAPECLEMSCGSIPNVAHARFEGRDQKTFEPGETVLYQCKEGFVTVGSPEIICREGNWTPPPLCKAGSCGPAPEIPNGHVASTPQESYLPGAKVHYQCEGNFEMTGENFVTCIKGQWSQAPVCGDMRCNPPPEIAGGRINIKKSKYLPGETANYECWQGFKMTGTSTVVCQNGIWTELPKCKGKGRKCGPPSGIESGELLSFFRPEYEQGETLDYKCPSFYVLEGSKRITCTDGKWSNPPVCLVACTASEEDMARNNIELKWSHKNKLYSISGDTIEFRCKPGYLEEQDLSHFRIKCVEGVLDYPRCRPLRNCTVATNHMETNNIQLRSHRLRTSTYRSGDLISFECKQGYQRVSKPEKFRAHCVDGEIIYPTCRRKCT